ncbi:MAG: UbiA family prenyltransferase, partial [Cyanobacteria bacterium NC_groundwater_1444_Ag_S-0.65um_54_12]|nr:UbiA family prenyltransferase [Cyanobacteria bacterium NC_groundwater_1444_Ag_S-0.65um_54_12]
MNHQAAPYPLSSPRFWDAYWITLRPYLFFVSGTGGLVGLAAAPDLSPGALGSAFLAFFASYGLGQALTDVSQIDTDSISSPYRPLVRGEITPRQVLLISLSGLLLCAVILAVLNPWTLIFSLAGVAGLASYTTFKRYWWGGPLWNSWIVALLPAIGLLCGSTGWQGLLRHPLS